MTISRELSKQIVFNFSGWLSFRAIRFYERAKVLLCTRVGGGGWGLFFGGGGRGGQVVE